MKNIFFSTYYSSLVLLDVCNKQADETFIIPAYFMYA